MTKESSDKLLMKVAALDKAPRLLAAVIGLRKQAAAEKRKAEVQTKLASIVDGVLNKTAAPADVVKAGADKVKTNIPAPADVVAGFKSLGGDTKTLTNYKQNIENNATPTNQGFVQNLADLIYGVPYKRGRAQGNAMNNIDAYLNYLYSKKVKEQAGKPYYR